MTLVNSLSISPILFELTAVLATLSTCQIKKGDLPTETFMFEIFTRKFGDPFYHFQYSRDGFLQNICLLADKFIYHLISQKKNSSQSIKIAHCNLVVFVYFLQALNGEALPRHSIRQ